MCTVHVKLGVQAVTTTVLLQSTKQAAFKSTLEYIDQQNAKSTNSFVLGVNNFSDLSFEEFAAKYLQATKPLPPSRMGKGKGGNRCDSSALQTF